MYADFLKVAEQAARVGGGILLEYLGMPVEVEFKGEVDIVTKVDRLSEEAIVAVIRDAYPDHQIMAEEGTAKKGDSQYRWIIDPLDGTTNYAHAFPCFAVVIKFQSLFSWNPHRNSRRVWGCGKNIMDQGQCEKY